MKVETVSRQEVLTNTRGKLGSKARTSGVRWYGIKEDNGRPYAYLKVRGCNMFREVHVTPMQEGKFSNLAMEKTLEVARAYCKRPYEGYQVSVTLPVWPDKLHTFAALRAPDIKHVRYSVDSPASVPCNMWVNLQIQLQGDGHE